MTIEIDRDVYYTLTEHLRHGQLTHIMQKFMNFFHAHPDEVFSWMYSKTTLTIPGKEN